MTTIGSIKAQITKAVKALRASMEQAEKLRTRQVPSNAPEGKSASVDSLAWATIEDAYLLLRRRTDKLEDRWERAEEFASERGEDAPGVLEEIRAHWEANACAESIEEAERLVLELRTARAQLERQAPSNGRLQEVNTVADSIELDGRQPSTPSQARPTERDSAQPRSGLGEEQLASRRDNSQALSPPIASLNGPTEGQGASAQFTQDTIQSVKLPPFELPEFKGDMHAFPEFWKMFAVVHDNPTVPTISKFLYLKGKLKGEAYKLISPLQFSEYNYQQAVQLLKKTYMRPDILRIQLMQELQAVAPAHDIPTSQRTTLCTLKALWVQLEKLGEHPASTAQKCTIGEKFPLHTMEKAGELKNAGEDWTANHLLDALDQVIDRQETLQGVHPALASAYVTQQHSSRSPSRAETRRPPPRRHFTERCRSHSPGRDNTSQRCRCPFCIRGRHEPDQCREISTQYARREIVRDRQLCWKCLQSGHRSTRCNAPACVYCSRSHHKALCYTRERSRSPARRNTSRRDHFSRPRSPRRRSSSTESRYSNGRSRSSSWSSRTPSPRRDRSPERRDSPHPRVGFRNPPVISDPVQSHHYTTSALESSDSSDTELEQLNDSGLQTRVQVAITPNASAKTVACRSRSLGRAPRLMIVEALTHNFNSKADQLLTVFLDSGSQHSFICKDTAQSLGLQFKHPKTITAITFGGYQHTEKSYQVKITLQNPVTGTPVRLKLWTRTHTTSVPGDMGVKTTPNYKKHLRTGSTNVDILIGMDYYWSVVHLNRNRQLSSGLVQSYTKLGPILSGPNAPFPRVLSTSVDQKAINTDTDSIVRKLLALDSEGLDEDRDTADSE